MSCFKCRLFACVNSVHVRNSEHLKKFLWAEKKTQRFESVHTCLIVESVKRQEPNQIWAKLYEIPLRNGCSFYVLYSLCECMCARPSSLLLFSYCRSGYLYVFISGACLYMHGNDDDNERTQTNIEKYSRVDTDVESSHV